MRVIFALVFLSFLSMGCKPTKQTAQVREQAPKAKKIDKMDFHYNESSTLTAVVDKAVAVNKLVFVDIYADWCTPCKLMDEDVFSDNEMTDFMKKHFVNYKVDGEKHNGPNIGVMFGIPGYPTLLISDQKGRILERNEGALYQTGLKDMANRALAKMSQ